MNRTTTLLIIVAAIAVVGGALLIVRYASDSEPSSASSYTQTTPSPSPTPEVSVPTPSQSIAPSASSSPSPVASPTPRPSLTPTPAPSAAIRAFDVTGQNFSFSPALITVKIGDRARVTFKNNGGMHNLVIDAFGARTATINGEEEDSIEFVADKTGSYPYYCSVRNHRAMGMQGIIVVE